MKLVIDAGEALTENRYASAPRVLETGLVTVYARSFNSSGPGWRRFKERWTGFVCSVGGDYRARYGVIVNERYAALTQYTGFNRYRVIVRRAQTPLP